MSSATRSAASALADEIAAIAPNVLERMNADYEDSVLLVGRVLGRVPGATAARITDVDAAGVAMRVVHAAGERTVEVRFAQAVTDAGQVTTQLLDLVRRARDESGEAGVTSAETMMAELTGLRTFLAEVVTVRDVHDHLRSITFSGADLATFAPVGPDTFLYVLLPPPGRPELTIDRSFTWAAYDEMPEADRPVGAYYTLRRWDPVRHEIEMLFVLHGDEGHASAWAGRAQVGDPVALWGPRTSFHPPADTEWYLLVADDTGLPAASAMFETLPAGAPVLAVLEVDGEHERLPLAERRDGRVVWVHRDGRPAGADATPVLDAVRSLDRPAGRGYAWGGGESRMMTAVRRHLRDEIGLDRSQVSLVAYWRR